MIEQINKFIKGFVLLNRMAGRKKEKLVYSYIAGDKNRKRIIELCKTPKSFTELKQILKLSTGSIAHHLEILEKAKVIEKTEIREGEGWKRGKQVSLLTNFSVLERLKIEEDNYWRAQGILPDEGIPPIERKILSDVFKIIEKIKREKKRPAEFWEIRKVLDDKKYKMDDLELTSFLQSTILNNVELFRFDISKEGIEKLEELKTE